MDSVINFLADYYIWFFVTAGVLCFALVGFIIESKKKEKNVFKGESIDNTKVEEPMVSGDTVNMNGTTTLEEASQETISSNEEVNPETLEVPKNEPQEVKEEVKLEEVPTETPVMEDTMEINDIPLKEEDKTPIEFYSEPVQVEKPVSSDTPVVELSNNTVENTNADTPSNNNENIETLNIFDDIK